MKSGDKQDDRMEIEFSRKREYISPKLTVYGDIKHIVQAGTTLPDEGTSGSTNCTILNKASHKLNTNCTGG